eukprot:930577-Pleurochrysis_carterae.AAC.3
MQSASRPKRLRNDAIPSGRTSGPENKMSTLLESSAVGSPGGCAASPSVGCAGSAVDDRSALSPREKGFAEVYFGSEDDLSFGWHPDVVGPGRGYATSEVGTDPGADLNAGLGVGLARLDCNGTATER